MIADAALVFVPMGAENLDAVMEIERRSFPEPWSPGLFLHELKVPFSRIILACAADASEQILGYICRWLVGDEMHILNLAVSPDRRQCGIGRALIGAILQEAEEYKVNLVTLEVRQENVEAIALYQSCGFAACGIRQHYYGRGHHAVIMSRTKEEATARAVLA